MQSLDITGVIVFAILLGILAQIFSKYFRLPSIVFLILLGCLFGKSGFGYINPDKLGNGFEIIITLFVALILFEGGLSLDLREMGKVSSSLRNIVTIGPGIILFTGSCLAHFF